MNDYLDKESRNFSFVTDDNVMEAYRAISRSHDIIDDLAYMLATDLRFILIKLGCTSGHAVDVLRAYFEITGGESYDKS